MKTFFVSYYGSQKILERKISYVDIPDLKKLSLGIHKMVKKISGRELVAFYRITTDAIILMTAYWRQK